MTATTPTTRAHIELERKLPISKSEYASLPAKLKRIGFKLSATSVIIDMLLPSESGDTHRIRREQFLYGPDPQVMFFETLKTHPQKPDGGHIRLEEEEERTAAEAELIIAEAVHKMRKPMPSYSKLRRTFVGDYKALGPTTVALDIAQGLCRYSGHYMEIEKILSRRSTLIVKTESRIIRLSQRLLGEHREAAMSYRKMLLLSVGARS
jgi:hypothetical protein